MIEKFTQVDAPLRGEIDELIRRSVPADQVETEIYTDHSLNLHKSMQCAFAYRDKGGLEGFLFVFAPRKDEIEISALVLPECRGQGRFKALLQAALEESRRYGYERGLLVCNRASQAGMQVMAHWGHPVDHIEYQMYCEITGPKHVPQEFSLEKALPEGVPELAELGAKIFGMDAASEASLIADSMNSPGRTQWKLLLNGRPIGMCSSVQEKGGVNLYGLGIHPDMRRQGYGRVLLDLMSGRALEVGAAALRLDVDSENPPALCLYRSYGFTEQSVTYYYRYTF